MPIEEKPQLLEFNCILEGMSEVIWNVKYDPNNPNALHVSGNGQELHCPAKLFEEVTNFLGQKGILKPQILTKTDLIPGIKPGGFASTLLPPKIDGKDNIPAGPPIDALSSFDITEDKQQSNISEKTTSGDKEIVNNNITSETEILNRPVIRSRVSKDDPLSAEKEGAVLRKSGSDYSKKVIKKKHREPE